MAGPEEIVCTLDPIPPRHWEEKELQRKQAD